MAWATLKKPSAARPSTLEMTIVPATVVESPSIELSQIGHP